MFYIYILINSFISWSTSENFHQFFRLLFFPNFVPSLSLFPPPPLPTPSSPSSLSTFSPPFLQRLHIPSARKLLPPKETKLNRIYYLILKLWFHLANNVRKVKMESGIHSCHIRVNSSLDTSYALCKGSEKKLEAWKLYKKSYV